MAAWPRMPRLKKGEGTKASHFEEMQKDNFLTQATCYFQRAGGSCSGSRQVQCQKESLPVLPKPCAQFALIRSGRESLNSHRELPGGTTLRAAHVGCTAYPPLQDFMLDESDQLRAGEFASCVWGTLCQAGWAGLLV